jgi:hypothetical protein
MQYPLRLSFLLLFAFFHLVSWAQPLDTTLYVTDGPTRQVNAIARSGNTIYIGGGFNYVGPPTGGSASFGAADGKLTRVPFAQINGIVYASVPDGKGGWFAGGTFSNAQGLTRYYLLHILPDGRLDPNWDPGIVYSNVNNCVRTMLLSDSLLYIGGNFTSIGGQPRSGLAAIHVASGQVAAWNPGVDKDVFTLARSGNTMYVGGNFTTVGGQRRANLAAVDMVTGQVTPWNPSVGGRVNALAATGSTLYVGGNFTTLAGLPRIDLAAVELATGQVTAWNPGVTGEVLTLAVYGANVYVGGGYYNIGGQPRNCLAALNAATGQVTAWNPDVSYSVDVLTVAGNTIYAGGAFLSWGTQARNKLAAFDAVTGQLTAWNPSASSTVKTIAVARGMVFVGGHFNTAGGQPRSRLAALDATTGQVTAWNPEADNDVHALVVANGMVYAGGRFTQISGQTRNRLAAIDGVTGQLSSWDANVTSTTTTLNAVIEVKALALSGTTLYVGGSFDRVWGQPRTCLAAVHAESGMVTPWNPSITSTVNALVVNQGSVFVGGGLPWPGGLPATGWRSLVRMTAAWVPGIPMPTVRYTRWPSRAIRFTPGGRSRP